MKKIKLAIKLYGKQTVKDVFYMVNNFGYNFASRNFEDNKNKKYLNCLELIF